LASLLSFVLFHSYRHLRDLPSFPTRRSSELCPIQLGTMRVMLFVRAVSGCVVTTSPSCQVSRPGSVLLSMDLRDCYSQATPRSRDRKSTRLNSSHRTISHAVFCLKKKNETKI